MLNGQLNPVERVIQNEKIFGIGLSRTGTTSLACALGLLGYKAAHFPCDPVTQREISRYCVDAKNFNLSILETYDAITDTPVCVVYQALDRLYPNSKFILTVRDKRNWLRSCERYWAAGLPEDLRTVPETSYVNFINLVNSCIYESEVFNTELFSRAYNTYVDGVIRHFTGRNDVLLVLDICAGEGWAQLCPFLNRCVPDLPFPRLKGSFLSR